MTDPKKAAADSSFDRKQAAARDGAKAMAQYEAEGKAIRAKTEKLRALRLARDAAELEAKKNEPVKAKAVKKTAAKKSVAKKTADKGGLSTWLDSEEKAGRRG
jgi:hypothetical protein